MKSSPRQSVRSSWVLSGIGLALVLTQSGCPGGADLENPQAWSNRIGTENGATAGSGGMSPSGPVLDFSTVACASSLLRTTNSSGIASVDFLNVTCATPFCHGTTPSAGLDLHPDSGFAARTRGVAATFGAILCPGDVLNECVPDSCPTGAELVATADPASSWLLLKSLGMQNGCGTSMPQGKPALSGDAAACMTSIVEAVAALK